MDFLPFLRVSRKRENRLRFSVAREKGQDGLGVAGICADGGIGTVEGGCVLGGKDGGEAITLAGLAEELRAQTAASGVKAREGHGKFGQAHVVGMAVLVDEAGTDGDRARRMSVMSSCTVRQPRNWFTWG